MRKNMLLFVLICIFVASIISGCSKAEIPAAGSNNADEGNKKDVNLTIATSNLTGTWYIWGGALSKVITEKIPGYTASPQVTDGPLSNLQMLENDEVMLTLGNTAVCYEAWHGQGIASPDGKKYQKQRSLFMAYPSYFHNITLNKTGIKNISDLEGKVVSCAPPGSGPNYAMEYSLEALGIKAKEKVYGGVDAAMDLLKDGKISNVVLAMGIPVGSVTDLAMNHDVKFIDYTEEQLDIVKTKYPFLVPSIIPANTYKGQAEDVNTVEFWNMIICHKDLDDDLAYKICEESFKNIDYFLNAHASARDMKMENFVNSPIPMHPGAVRFFKDKGFEIPDSLISPEMK